MIKVENITVLYPDGKAALKNLSCAVAHGDSCALLGENGAGKSTLLQALLGLLPLKEGVAHLDGIAVEKKNLREIRRRAGLVFQNSDDQLFCATIGDDVAFGLKELGLPSDEAREKALKIMEQLGVAHLCERSPQRLSDGEKKRAAIAGVLAMNPAVLLLDEPTAQLDPRARRELAELLHSVPCTRLIATHDLALAKKLCPSCIVLKDGMLAAAGKTAEILEDEELLLECGLR